MFISNSVVTRNKNDSSRPRLRPSTSDHIYCKIWSRRHGHNMSSHHCASLFFTFEPLFLRRSSSRRSMVRRSSLWTPLFALRHTCLLLALQSRPLRVVSHDFRTPFLPTGFSNVDAQLRNWSDGHWASDKQLRHGDSRRLEHGRGRQLEHGRPRGWRLEHSRGRRLEHGRGRGVLICRRWGDDRCEDRRRRSLRRRRYPG